jgi:hypothetical protein
MTDDEPNIVSMEAAMQAIRDALGHRESLKPQICNNQHQQEAIPKLPRDDDFFVKRLADIEESNMERLCRTIPLITDCIEKIGWLGSRRGKFPWYSVKRQMSWIKPRKDAS